MVFNVTSDRARQVDGLGVFAEGETRSFTLDEIKRFVRQTGVPLVDAFPEGLAVEVETGE